MFKIKHQLDDLAVNGTDYQTVPVIQTLSPPPPWWCLIHKKACSERWLHKQGTQFVFVWTFQWLFVFVQMTVWETSFHCYPKLGSSSILPIPDSLNLVFNLRVQEKKKFGVFFIQSRFNPKNPGVITVILTC